MESLTEIGYQVFHFQALSSRGDNLTHPVYHRGTGPAVLVIQELPGIGREMLRLASRLEEGGFEVFMPHLFGPLGKTDPVGNSVRVMCMQREFSIFSSRKTSPITSWLRALCKSIAGRSQRPKIGVIGMCLSGNFALSLMTEPQVHAAVSSQPSIPIHRHDVLHMSDHELSQLRDAIDSKGPVHAYRFAGDPLCTSRRFRSLDEALNSPGNERVVLHTLPGLGHAVLTTHFVDKQGHPTWEALRDVIHYFQSQLTQP